MTFPNREITEKRKMETCKFGEGSPASMAIILYIFDKFVIFLRSPRPFLEATLITTGRSSHIVASFSNGFSCLAVRSLKSNLRSSLLFIDPFPLVYLSFYKENDDPRGSFPLAHKLTILLSSPNDIFILLSP